MTLISLFGLRRAIAALGVLSLALFLVVGCQTSTAPDAGGEGAESAAEGESANETDGTDQTGEVEPGVPAYMVKGDINAPVTLYEWSDYECPYCSKYSEETWPQIAQEYVDSGQVRVIFRDFPLKNMHPSAVKASEAARCAGELGGSDAYWAMHDQIFAVQADWSAKEVDGAVADFKTMASELGVDQAEFDLCLDSGEQAAAVEASLKVGMDEGIKATPSFMLAGTLIEGAYPFEAFADKLDIVLAGGELPTPHPDWKEVVAPVVELDPGDAPVKGDPDAPVTIIEFSDYQCPYCAQFFLTSGPTIEQMVDEGRVKFMFVDLPLASLHPQAVISAQAAHCARDQGGDEAFFAMHDALFAGQQDWSGADDVSAVFAGYADEAGLDGAALQACVDAETHSDTVQAGFDLSRSIGLNGTPSFVINNQSTAGGMQPEMLLAMVEAAENGDPVKTWVPWEVAMATETAAAAEE